MTYSPKFQGYQCTRLKSNSPDPTTCTLLPMWWSWRPCPGWGYDPGLRSWLFTCSCRLGNLACTGLHFLHW